MPRSQRLWWGFLVFWLLLLASNVLLTQGSRGFWLRVVTEGLGAALAVFNIIRVRRDRAASAD